MFEHSVKVPRHYKVAANIFKRAFTEGASVKTLLYDDKLRHHRINVLYALVTETIKHTADLDKILAFFEVFEKEPRLDPWLAKVLATELLFGKRNLPGNSKPVQTILSYKDSFEKYVQNHQDEFQIKDIRKPRYVRINTNLLTTSDAISAFQDEGYRFIRCTSGSYSDYLNQITSLSEWDFTQDYHVKTVFVFASGTKLHEDELYLENKIVLQDKATALPVHLLAPPPDSIALDMCSAPGMKTTQLAAYLRNTGQIYAVERDAKRYQTLCEFLKNTGCVNVKPINKDVLEIKKGEMDDVEYILLDPSCSGSGMDYCLYKYKDYEERLQKLTSLQEKLLKHAMNSFPSAKRIVYSTCSLYPEENERVVVNVVKASRAKWRVRDVKELLKGQWNNYGSCMYGTLGERCIYARPDSDFTVGFFVAVLERNEYSKNEFLNQSVKNKAPKTTNQQDDAKDDEKNKNKKEKRIEHQEIIQTANRDDDNFIEGTVDIEEIPKKNKKKRHEKYQQAYETENSIDDNALESTGVDEKNPKKKKKKKHDENLRAYEVTASNGDNVTESLISIEDIPKTSKKKRKRGEDRESLKNIIDNLGDLAVESKIVTSKKKKKRLESNEFNENVIIESDSTEAVTSKSKKRKKYEDTNEAEVLAESQMKSEVTSQKNRDKKAAKTVEQMELTIPLDEAGAVSEKKKKNKKRKA